MRQQQVKTTYNFVPFSDKILEYPKEWKGVPAQNELDKTNALKSGEIHITLTAETALYISNGKGGNDNDFFTLPDNTYAVPGSSLRGMIYTNMKILGFGLVRSDEDITGNYVKGLPKGHRERQRPNLNYLDFPHAIMGYVNMSKSEKDDTLRSRVSFGNCRIVKKCGRMNRQYMSPRSPRLSDNGLYSLGKEKVSSDAFLLRGYKLYWLQEEAIFSDTNGYITFRPMVPGTTFSGVIHYNNLRPEELGLLLWALRLDEGCYQSIGFGKPQGMGRISLTIDRLVEYDFRQLYSSGGFFPMQQETDADAVSRYIDCYDKYASAVLGSDGSIRSMPEIQDFFYMHSRLCTSNYGPSYAEGESLPTVAEIRKTENEIRQSQQSMANNFELDPDNEPGKVNDDLLAKLQHSGLVKRKNDEPRQRSKKSKKGRK